MCTRAFTYHLRCGHSTFKDVNSRGCHLYHRGEHFCPQNHDKIKHDPDNICRKCARSLRDASVNLAFKIESFGNGYSSSSSSGHSTSSNGSFSSLGLPATLMSMDDDALSSIREEEEDSCPELVFQIRKTPAGTAPL
jgi:hypothetical protein